MKSMAKTFLETRGQSLIVQMEVDIILVGFGGDGGYAWRLSPDQLLPMLAGSMPYYCPSSWETEEQLGICFHINYQVLGADEYPAISNLLHGLEVQMTGLMTEVHSAFDETANRTRRFYSLEASSLEPQFDAFLLNLFPGERGRASTAHEHNVIFVVNPDKVRMNPAGDNGTERSAPDLISNWKWSELNSEALATEEADYVYRYQYGGTGEASSWISSANYLVLDVAAGPTSYGPAVSRSGGVAGGIVPAVRDALRSIFAELQSTGGQMTAQGMVYERADASRSKLFAAELAAELMAAVRHVFTPDMTSQHLEWASSVLVPLVVISDHPQPADLEEAEAQLEYQQFWDINVTQVEAALAELLDAQQQVVVIPSQAHLHSHPRLAVALRKAQRTQSEPVEHLERTSDTPGIDRTSGTHTASHSYIDTDLLLDALSKSADTLTQGLIDIAQYGGDEDDADVQRLRHQGTRVVPVFVFALKDAGTEVMFSNRDLVVANHDMVVALQLRAGTNWGVADNLWTGHVANGRNVHTDARASTRHVIAGLAQALAGLAPPYARWDTAEGELVYDWRWAVGATPFGPYSNFTGVSETMATVASRNMLLAHMGAALRHLQGRMDALDDFVEEHFAGPWLGGEAEVQSRRHWLDTMASTRQGFNRTLRTDVVQHLEASLGNISVHLEQLSVFLFVKDWSGAQRVLANELLPRAGALSRELDAQLAAAEQVMQCCVALPRSGVQRALLVVLAGAAGAAVVVALVVVGLVARGKAKKVVLETYGGLPTYGLPTRSSYSFGGSRPGSASGHRMHALPL